jgi:hypothetical protein
VRYRGSVSKRCARVAKTFQAASVHLVNAVVIVGFAAVCVFSASQIVGVAKMLSRHTGDGFASRTYRIGDSLPQLQGLNYAAQPYTLGVVLRSGCRYCTASLPFYRDILANRRDPKLLSIVGLCIEAVDTCRAYLEKHGVSLDKLISIGAGTLRVPGTPTIFIANRAGRVEGIWVGRQTDGNQRSINGLINRLIAAN